MSVWLLWNKILNELSILYIEKDKNKDLDNGIILKYIFKKKNNILIKLNQLILYIILFLPVGIMNKYDKKRTYIVYIIK